ncbi:MAG: di-trans,poly-cis-decaprenylcistransferase [Bacteroidales bacterium]|nr:di-trans,poly-cis-decaprenylcistransferase [Bacteroidales bacterium]
MSLQNKSIPAHVAIIMDGNGRWAQQEGHERTYGHQHALTAVREAISCAAESGVRYLTLYAFSTENWNRPKEEVDLLMSLFVQAMHNELDELNASHVRLLITGRIEDLPEDCQQTMRHAMEVTANNKGLTVILALSYSGRAELTDMTRNIARLVASGKLTPEEITTNTICQNLYLPEVPDPDILIRTGGDTRVSNFLLWEIAYTELFFLPILWPDFRKKDLLEVIDQYQNRERRFGKTSAQVSKK